MVGSLCRDAIDRLERWLSAYRMTRPAVPAVEPPQKRDTKMVRNDTSTAQFPHTETKQYLRNAAVPGRFEQHSHVGRWRPDWLLGAAGFEPLHQNRRVQPRGRDGTVSRRYLNAPLARSPGRARAMSLLRKRGRGRWIACSFARSRGPTWRMLDSGSTPSANRIVSLLRCDPVKISAFCGAFPAKLCTAEPANSVACILSPRFFSRPLDYGNLVRIFM
jgi:hypothetical protein